MMTTKYFSYVLCGQTTVTTTEEDYTHPVPVIHIRTNVVVLRVQ